jgi:hypothetical protein
MFTSGSVSPGSGSKVKDYKLLYIRSRNIMSISAGVWQIVRECRVARVGLFPGRAFGINELSKDKV